MPVGVGSEGAVTLKAADMDRLLTQGMAYTEQLGLSWPEDRHVTEEQVGALLQQGGAVGLLRPVSHPTATALHIAYEIWGCWEEA